MYKNCVLAFSFAGFSTVVFSQSTIVNFGDATRASGGSLQIGGVTASSSGGGASVVTFPTAPVATGAGSGLGVDGGIGPVNEFNSEYIFTGSGSVDEYTEPWLNLQANGVIDSVTILFSLNVYAPDGSLLPAQDIPFYVLAIEGGSTAWYNGGPETEVDPASPNPTTINLCYSSPNLGNNGNIFAGLCYGGNGK